MRITVCEMPDGVREFEVAWEALREHLEARRSELVVLPETPGALLAAETSGRSSPRTPSSPPGSPPSRPRARNSPRRGVG